MLVEAVNRLLFVLVLIGKAVASVVLAMAAPLEVQALLLRLLSCDFVLVLPFIRPWHCIGGWVLFTLLRPST